MMIMVLTTATVTMVLKMMMTVERGAAVVVP
jgi:hypothetical protein